MAKKIEDEEVIDEEKSISPVNEKEIFTFATILAIGLILNSAILYSVVIPLTVN